MFEIDESLKTAIREGREEAEQTRQLSATVVTAIKTGQLNTMAVAQTYGGSGATLSDMAGVLEAIAYEDAAVSWVVWNSTLVGLYARFMPAPLREELFQSGNELFCQSTIPAGELELATEHATVTGRWPLMSGSPCADWALFTCKVSNDGEPVLNALGMLETRIAALPRAEFEILDTWHTSGLRGTGSHDVHVASVKVPHSRTFGIGGIPDRQTPSDCLPLFASVSALYAAQLLGLARAVFDASFDRVQRSCATGPMPALKDRENIQIAIARHGAGLEASAHLLDRAIKRIDSRAINCLEPDRKDVANLYSASMFATDTVQRSTKEWAKLAGTSALYTDSPIEKRVRDLSAMGYHIVAQPSFQADAGRLALDLDPLWPLFLV